MKMLEEKEIRVIIFSNKTTTVINTLFVNKCITKCFFLTWRRVCLFFLTWRRVCLSQDFGSFRVLKPSASGSELRHADFFSFT